MKDSTARLVWYPLLAILCVGIWVLATIGFVSLFEREPRPAVYLLSTQEYAIACPEWTPPEDIPLMWVVRYVKDGALVEIPTYSEEERDGLMAYLRGGE